MKKAEWEWWKALAAEDVLEGRGANVDSYYLLTVARHGKVHWARDATGFCCWLGPEAETLTIRWEGVHGHRRPTCLHCLPYDAGSSSPREQYPGDDADREPDRAPERRVLPN